MSDGEWTSIGMPKRVKEKIEENKAKGQTTHAYIEELIDKVNQ